MITQKDIKGLLDQLLRNITEGLLLMNLRICLSKEKTNFRFVTK